jgi:hypothetical protein
MPTRPSIEICPQFDEHGLSASFAGRDDSQFRRPVDAAPRWMAAGPSAGATRAMTTA